jgi:hypothetical protein
MNTVQTALSSARFNRLILWLGVLVFAAGALALVFTFAGGSDTRADNPDKGFHATLPKNTHPLKTTFQLGLVPVAKKWLVSYFMPRWTPPVPNQQ